MEIFRLASIINPFSDEETKKDLDRAYKEYKQNNKLNHLILNNNLEIVRNPGDYILALENNFKSMPGVRERFYDQSPSFPLGFSMEVTTNCNSKCKMCSRHIKKRPDIDLSFEDFKKIVDQMREHKLIDFYLYRLGEPFLNPELPKMLEYIRHFNNIEYLWISSNGLDLTTEHVKMLLDSNITIFNMSVNAMSGKEYSRINDIDNSEERYYQVINNFKNAFKIKNESGKRKPFFRVQMIENKYNKGRGQEFIEEWENLADIINVGILEFSSKLDFNKSINVERKKNFTSVCRKPSTYHFFMYNDGSVVPCMEDINAECLKIGDWRKQTIQEMFDSKIYRDFLNTHFNGSKDNIPFCSKCVDYDF